MGTNPMAHLGKINMAALKRPFIRDNSKKHDWDHSRDAESAENDG